MPIATISISALVGKASSVSGSFTTDANPEVTTTTTADATANQTALTVVTTAGFESAADYLTLAGAGLNGADANIQVTALGVSGVNAATRVTIPGFAIKTTAPSGAAVARWNRIAITARPKHVRITRRDNGDYFDWTDGMEPVSANTSIGGVQSLQARVMLCQPGAIHIAPGILAASQTYDIVIDY
ncbi:hypothetical protein ASF61_06825 [Duganella sp. Leaf126]|uniref:hypothetical protein n=1 Tax=Duganella sp. Leaf126 TaxID=1736266 RepID=UPI0006F61B43|nr:hypothetical protein [Duganella sp. Leaf126]KQQ40460.1 hypothetical protein ASF61_06825 [Duganella sp. Leaf126]